MTSTRTAHCIAFVILPIHLDAVLPGFDGFDVRKIDDHEYTVEISCYFLTKWKDDRLVLHNDIIAPNKFVLIIFYFSLPVGNTIHFLCSHFYSIPNLA